MVDAIHIHEDNWGMRNLYPIAVEEEAAADILAANESGKRNRAADGLGWTDVHAIVPPSLSYVDVGLKLSDAANALVAILPRVKRFNATISACIGTDRFDPLGSYSDEAWCFGRSENCFVKLEPQGELVRDVWFELNRNDADDAAVIRAAIEAVNALAPSCLADYWLDFEGPATCDGLDEYFSLHKACTIEAEARWQAYLEEKSPSRRSFPNWRRWVPWLRGRSN